MIKLLWISGNEGFAGNEEADKKQRKEQQANGFHEVLKKLARQMLD